MAPTQDEAERLSVWLAAPGNAVEALSPPERFLATIGSDVEGLRAQLKPGAMIHIEQYEKETLTARYLKTDGVSYICFIVIGVSLEDARRIALASRETPGWSTADFRKSVGKALGGVMPPAILD